MPSLAPHATNEHKVTTTPLDLTAEGAPTAQTMHGLSVGHENAIVGRIVSWNPQAYQRNVTHIYELNHKTFGRPVDAVPGTSQGYTISMTRTELWDDEIELSFGFDLFTDLADQTRPFKCDEYLFRGASTYRHWQYSGCWFQDRNLEGYQAEGEAAIRVSATLLYVSRQRLK